MTAALSNTRPSQLHTDLSLLIEKVESQEHKKALQALVAKASASAGIRPAIPEARELLLKIKAASANLAPLIAKIELEIATLFPVSAIHITPSDFVCIEKNTKLKVLHIGPSPLFSRETITRLEKVLKPTKLSEALALVRFSILTDALTRVDIKRLSLAVFRDKESFEGRLVAMMRLCEEKLIGSCYAKAGKFAAGQRLLASIKTETDQLAAEASIRDTLRLWLQDTKKPLNLPPAPTLRHFEFLAPLFIEMTPAQLKATVTAAARTYPQAESFNFSMSRISPSTIDLLAQFPQLQKLSFASCAHLSSSHLESLSTLTYLTHLNLNNCPAITDDDMVYIQNMATLSTLSLVGNGLLSDSCCTSLLNLRELRHLDISNSMISPARAQLLKGQIKGLTIVHTPIPEEYEQLGKEELQQALKAWQKDTTQPLVFPAAATHLFAITTIDEVDLFDFTHAPDALRKIFEKLVECCPHLTAIDCSGSMVAPQTIELFAGFKRLTKLLFSDSEKAQKHLGEAHLAAVATLPSLTSLTLHNLKPLAASAFQCLQTLPLLTTLDLRHSEISDQNMIDITKMTRLRCLNLGYCSALTWEGLSLLGKLTHLQEATLSYTKYSSDTLHHLSELEELHTLVLAGISHREQRTGLAWLQSATGLRALDISFAEDMTEEDMRAVTGITQLETLDLASIRELNDDMLRHVARMNRLTWLNLIGCLEVTNESLKALRKSLPRLVISEALSPSVRHITLGAAIVLNEANFSALLRGLPALESINFDQVPPLNLQSLAHEIHAIAAEQDRDSKKPEDEIYS